MERDSSGLAEAPRPRGRRAVGTVVGLAALAVLLLDGFPRVASGTRGLLGAALAHAGEDVLAARRRVFGAPYTDAVEAIKAAIPERGEYLLVATDLAGSYLYVAYDLAPRRARYLDEWPTPGRVRRHGRPADAPAFVVVAGATGEAPRLLTVEQFYLGADGR